MLLGFSFLLIWAAYGFCIGGFTLPSGRWLTLPAAPYFQGAVFQFLQSQSPHSFFLMGMHSEFGWWYYFIVVCLIKIPLGVLLLLAALAVGHRWLGNTWRPDELYLLLPFALLFVYLSAFNTIQNGFRYLLPVYPLLLIWLCNYGAALVQAISSSRLVVLVYSAAANASPQVRREVERAGSKDVPILPVRIEDAPLSRSLEYFLSAGHWLDATQGPLEAHLERLTDAVQRLLARSAAG